MVKDTLEGALSERGAVRPHLPPWERLPSFGGATDVVELSQPISGREVRARAHGELKIWHEYPLDRPLVDGCRVSITHLQSSTHLGTHVDAPLHFIPGGRSVDQIELHRFIRPAVTASFDLSGPEPVDAVRLRSALPEVVPGDLVFLRFGYADLACTDDYHHHPFLTPDAAQLLVDLGASGVGMDVLTPDVPSTHRDGDFEFPVHRLLLGNDLLIIENMGRGLAEIAEERVLVAAPPVRIEGSDGAMLAMVAFKGVEGL